MTQAMRVLEAVEERRTAIDTLISQPFVDAGTAEYALIRRHETDLARTCADVFGYRLEVGPTAARIVGVPTLASLQRPLRMRPQTTTGAKRPVDEWSELGDRGAVLLCLTLAVLERGGAQIAIAELARAVQRVGAEGEPPMHVVFEQRAERLAFADGLDLLCGWGVLVHTSGARESYARREQGDDEALLTVDRRRLALLLRDPVGALRATSLDDLLDESASYAPSEEGERRQRSHRLARQLLEDPALVLSDLSDDDRAYFHGQRARLERAVHDATGIAVERRAEGTALVVEERRFTDVPFPTNGTVKQLALLLCSVLLDASAALSFERSRAAVRELMRRHQAHWQRDPDDPAQVDDLLRGAVAVLCALDLAVSDGDGVRARPLCGRFRDPTWRQTGAAR